MELTATQLNKLPAYRDFWRQQVVSTARVDRPAAEEAIRRLYRDLNKPEPECFLWFDAPREAAGATNILLLEQDPDFFAEYWGTLVRGKRAEWERVRTLIVSPVWPRGMGGGTPTPDPAGESSQVAGSPPGVIL